MWMPDLQVALNELMEIYGMTCCVARIHDNIFVMSNGEKWEMDRGGHVERIEEN